METETVIKYRGMTKKALERTKAACQDAFRLISCDDARHEGFFRRAGPLTERFSALKAESEHYERTAEGIYVRSVGDFTIVRSVKLHNELFSVSAGIFYYERGRIDPDYSEDQVRAVHLQGIRLEGESMQQFIFHLEPERSWSGVHVQAYFSGFSTTGQSITSDSLATVQSIQGINALLIHHHPENNYEMARIALNLLAEFEAMLDSAIRHFERRE